MMIDTVWLTENDEGFVYCTHCAYAEGDHTESRAWLLRDNKNIGSLRAVRCPNSEKTFVDRIELWDDAAKQERATKAMQEQEWQHYKQINMENMRGLKKAIATQDLTHIATSTKDVPVSHKAKTPPKEQSSWNGYSKHQLEKVLTDIHKVMRQKYKRVKHAKYGSTNKGFEESELSIFFAHCTNEKAHFAFKLQALLGLRIGETVRIKIEDVDLQNASIRVRTEKSGTGDILPLHPEAIALIKTWITKHYTKIKENDNFLLWSGMNGRKAISIDLLRNHFRETIKKAGLNIVYASSEEPTGRPIRQLHRLGTHSLRHYFGTRIYKSTKDPVLTQKLLRQRDAKSTSIYINSSQNDLRDALNKTFNRRKAGDSNSHQ